MQRSPWEAKYISKKRKKVVPSPLPWFALCETEHKDPHKPFCFLLSGRQKKHPDTWGLFSPHPFLLRNPCSVHTGFFVLLTPESWASTSCCSPASVSFHSGPELAHKCCPGSKTLQHFQNTQLRCREGEKLMLNDHREMSFYPFTLSRECKRKIWNSKSISW